MKINQPSEFKRIQFIGSPFRGKEWEALKSRKAEEIKIPINEISGLHCVCCKREIIIGELRYPTSTSGNTNRCSQCYYSIKIK